MKPTNGDEFSTRRTTDVFSANPKVIDLRAYDHSVGRGFATEMANEYDLAADDADLEFLLQPPRDLSERATIRRRWRWERVWLRIATVAWAFTFGVAIAIGYDVVTFILLGVALACAFVVVEQ